MFYRRCHLFRAGGGRSLQYRDVMVMTSKGSQLQDDVRDDAGRVTSPASGFVRGLRQAGVPVCVLEGSDRARGSNRAGGSDRAGGTGSGSDSDSDSGRVVDRAGWESRVADVAVSRTDRVTVSECECVQGLERRVVVWLAEWGEDWPVDAPPSLFAASCCTTQFITVFPPLPDPSDSDSSHSTHSTTTPHTTDDEDETTEEDDSDDAGVSHVVSVGV